MSTSLEALKGEYAIPPSQGIYDISSTAKAQLGTRIEFSDGRVFRYALNGAVALTPGTILTSLVVNALKLNLAVEAAVPLDGTSLTVTTTVAVTTGAEGFVQINDAAGEGIQYKIKSSKANADTSTSTDIELYDPIATALTTDSQATIVPSLYTDLVISATVTDHIIGVAPIAVTAEYYFWVQTWGLCPVLSTAATAVGSRVVPSATDGGYVIATARTSNEIGFAYGTVGVSTEYKPIYLQITP